LGRSAHATNPGERAAHLLATGQGRLWARGSDVALATSGDPGHCTRPGLSRTFIFHPHARITDVLRTHVCLWRTGVDAPDRSRIFRSGSDGDRAYRLRVAGMETVRRRVEEPRVPATIGATRRRRT